MDKSTILSEIKFKAVRSSGAGGQHVNKVSTKVELTLDILQSQAFSKEEKSRLLEKLKHKLTKENLLIIQSQDSRSQLKNKKDAQAKLLQLIKNALIVPKKRRKTTPSKKAIQKRLTSKKLRAEKKAWRGKVDY